jgi:hypothetical protein
MTLRLRHDPSILCSTSTTTTCGTSERLPRNQEMENSDRTQSDIDEFEERLHALRPNLKVFQLLARKSDYEIIRRAEPPQEGQIYRWFRRMGSFYQICQQGLKIDRLMNWTEVKIALIDSGVDIFDHELRGRITSLSSINDQDGQGSTHQDEAWHGTLMAKAVCRMAPRSMIRLNAINFNPRRHPLGGEAGLMLRSATEVSVFSLPYAASGAIQRRSYLQR